MNKIVALTLVSTLAAFLVLVQFGEIPSVNASPSVHQGNLLITGNNVTTITGRFDMNGSITIEGNATLQLQNAVLNFTQNAKGQFKINMKNPAKGRPRLVAYDSTITSNYDFSIFLLWKQQCCSQQLNHRRVNQPEGEFHASRYELF